jgi:hypothetical protein
MIIISDRFLSFLTYFLGGGQLPAAMAFFPFVIVNSQVEVTPELINHEKIHLRQQIEMLLLPFYIWYLIAFYRKGYWDISFEKEAYDNENDLTYLKKRRIFAFLKYM